MEILNEARAVYSEIQAVRHQLHRCPELGHREVETTRLIRACLEEYGAEVLDYGFPTGLAARIRGGHPGKLLALREDIDALPILENTGLPFASQTPGVCHACGHDVHTAALLGCAKLLARRREELWGDVLLIFQCGEETFDGAAAMLSQGLFRDGTPHAVVGFHCAPDLPLGTISIREGIANASCDSIRLEVTGKGGHGAHPELCVDPVVLSAGLLMQLQTLVSRNNNPADPVVWRGPVIAGAVKQFWTDVIWEDVDYLFVDMPPGTGDVPLTVFQSLPVDGIVVVASPQELVSMIVAKAVNMAEMMKVPMLGIVENMSYIVCPDCGKHISVFGNSHVDEVAAKHHLPVLAKCPIDPQLAALSDAGMIETYGGEYLEGAADACEKLLKK